MQAARVGDLDKRCGELLRANEVFEAQLRSTASDRDDLRIRVMELEQRGQILQKDKAYFSQSNDALVRCGLLFYVVVGGGRCSSMQKGRQSVVAWRGVTSVVNACLL